MVPDGLTIEQYFGWLTDSTHIAKTPFSASVKEYLTSNASKLFELRRSGGGTAAQATGPLTDRERQELLMLCATEHLWGYLNATFIRCPACGQEMQLNWGWCPYHPQFDKQIYKRQDENESGTWKDEFIKELKDKDGSWRLDERVFGERAAGNLSIVDYLEKISPKEETRLFVHSSEFIVVK